MIKFSPYIKIARPKHWFKNIFIIPGILLVYFFHPELSSEISFFKIMLGIVAACLTASSNYVLNEILDSKFDIYHPKKKNRPIPSGQVSIKLAYIWWLLLAAAAFIVSLNIGERFFYVIAAFWTQGLIYNIPPIRLKDIPYADVICESINNPIRMLIGWYSTGVGSTPTLSILLAYWMFGAFLMACKRFAEYRMINNETTTALYRKSFKFYNEIRLLESMMFYTALFAMFSGVFIARYKIELVLATPLICLTLAYYFRLSFKENSPVQHPEYLYKSKRLTILVFCSFLLCFVLLFADIPIFQAMFKTWHKHTWFR